jgi:hypothetical protein
MSVVHLKKSVIVPERFEAALMLISVRARFHCGKRYSREATGPRPPQNL